MSCTWFVTVKPEIYKSAVCSTVNVKRSFKVLFTEWQRRSWIKPAKTIGSSYRWQMLSSVLLHFLTQIWKSHWCKKQMSTSTVHWDFLLQCSHLCFSPRRTFTSLIKTLKKAHERKPIFNTRRLKLSLMNQITQLRQRVEPSFSVSLCIVSLCSLWQQECKMS